MTSKTTILVAAIANYGPAPCSLLSHKSGLSTRDIGKIICRLLRHKRISRLKPPLSEGGGYYRYFMTEAQLEKFWSSIPRNKFEVSPADAVAKLRFLTNLCNNPVYADHHLLTSIIEDYRKALKAEVDKEDNTRASNAHNPYKPLRPSDSF